MLELGFKASDVYERDLQEHEDGMSLQLEEAQEEEESEELELQNEEEAEEPYVEDELLLRLEKKPKEEEEELELQVQEEEEEEELELQVQEEEGKEVELKEEDEEFNDDKVALPVESHEEEEVDNLDEGAELEAWLVKQRKENEEHQDDEEEKNKDGKQEETLAEKSDAYHQRETGGREVEEKERHEIAEDSGKTSEQSSINTLEARSRAALFNQLDSAMSSYAVGDVHRTLKRMREHGVSVDEPLVKRARCLVRHEAANLIQTAETFIQGGMLPQAREKLVRALELTPINRAASLLLVECDNRQLPTLQPKGEQSNSEGDMPSHDFLLKVCAQLRDKHRSLSGRHPAAACVFVARAIVDALGAGKFLKRPASHATVQYCQWGATVGIDDVSGLVCHYKLDLDTEMPNSLSPWLPVVPMSKFLRLPSALLADLPSCISRATSGGPGFGMVVLAGKAQRDGSGSVAAGHVLLFYVSNTGHVQFVDVSQEQPQHRIFNSFERRTGFYEALGLQTKVVFYFFCSGQTVKGCDMPSLAVAPVRHLSQASWTSGMVQIIKRTQALTQLTLGHSQRQSQASL